MEPESSPALDDEARHDERLVRAAQNGDLASFNALVTRHERAVFAVCYRMLRETTAAEDATQDTFVKAWTSIDSFRGGLFRPWLLRIATNRCLDIIRARGRRPADSLDAEPVEVEPRWTSQTAGAEHPESFAARTELSGFLEHALAQLPEDQRAVIILSDIHGHSYDEIAGIVGVAVGTVKSRISRSRSRLREILNADPEARELFERFLRHYDD
ncbi:MAG: RNA polymerase sigma factor [Thermomicrobiales bacterium]|nr:RNA polymerase sigma factor [Thermomicrobiales bacterium]